MPILRLNASPHLKSASRYLQAFAKNVHSQFGEDGIIAAIFLALGEGTRTCVEFGAWDGRHLSNTAALIEQGWNALLIEGHPERFRDLQATHGANPRVVAMNCYVALEPNSDHALTNLLDRAGIGGDFDLLSIDIDGNDYHVWNTLARRPRLVVIEFNPTIPNDVVYVQDPVANLNHGCSLAALVELGKSKGYELAATTAGNAFFVRDDLFPALRIEDNGIDAIHESALQSRFFQLYDGTLMLAGCRHLIWHELPIDHERMQMLPPEQRRFPGAVT